MTFRELVRTARIVGRPGSGRPRLHDFRHSFATRTLISAYQNGDDIDRSLMLLATYLGHVHPTSTYWYLSAPPELLQLAADRMVRLTGESS